MAKYKHSFWRYIPSSKDKKSAFKFVETKETDTEDIPDLHDYYCIDHMTNLETGQMRVKNHSAPGYCVSKYIGISLELPPVEKSNKQEIYMVIHKSIDKIEFDQFLEQKIKDIHKKNGNLSSKLLKINSIQPKI